ncbi:MAG: putative LPS assembly protein LptD [Bacteroidales bacterium]
MKKGGTAKWCANQMQYTANLDNRINTTDSLLFTDQVWNDMNNGFKHEIPISIPIRPFNNFTISPQVRYTGVLYSRMTRKTWVEDYYDPETNDTISKLVEEQIPDSFYGQALSPQIGASYNSQIFGTFTFNNPDSKIIAIRHVLKTSVSFSLVPAVQGLSTDMYRTVQKDTLGNMTEYSIFQNSIYGTPSLPGKSGSLNFSLTNIIEAKVRTRNDTTGKGEKVKILDNLGFNTSYNLFADSLKWAPIRMTMRTRLAKEIDISASGSLDPYGVDSLYRRINASAWTMNNKLVRLTSFNVSVGFDLGRLIDNFTGGRKSQNEAVSQQPDRAAEPALREDPTTNPGDDIIGGEMGRPTTMGGLLFDEYGYASFNVPWSLRFSYTFYYSKSQAEPVIRQNFTLNGDVRLTGNTSIRYSSGYDIKAREITMTTIGITRDLHCWEMSFNWVPMGYLQSWDFTIRVKASVLQYLKYERRKDFHDNR